jgi:hypothetical protein
MKRTITTLLIIYSAFANAQEVHVATANLDRLKYKTGVVILYYATNRVVSYCNLGDEKI